MNIKAGSGPVDRPVRVGSTWLVNKEFVTIVAIKAVDRIVVRDATGVERVVGPGDLQNPESADGPALGSAEIAAIPSKQWERARLMQEDVERVLQSRRVGAPEVRALARQWDVSLTTAWRHVNRYRRERSLLAFTGSRRGPKRGATLLTAELEEIIQSVAQRWWRQTENATVAEISPSIALECHARGFLCPSRATISRRLRLLRKDPDNFSGEVRAAMRERVRLVKGSYQVEQPLGVVQIDHTVADVFIVDPASREPIGRPTLTLAIDIATRCVLGMCLSLEAPSALLVALCLEHAVFPKEGWLREQGLAIDWPMYGRMAAVHTDNGKEFHSCAFRRGCDLNRIEVIYRPPATPRFGGHVERLIGTLMRKVRLLPGNSYSDVLRRRPQKAERHALLTLEELRWYLCEQIARYHHTTHRALGLSPRSTWERGWARSRGIELPPVPANRAKFLLDFLPPVRRIVGREGIEIYGLRYSSPALAPEVQPGISRVYLERTGATYLTVPLRDPSGPVMSLWEWRARRKRRRPSTGPMDAKELAAEINWMEGTTRLRQRRNVARSTEWKVLQAIQALPAPRVRSIPSISSDSGIDELAWEVLE